MTPRILDNLNGVIGNPETPKFKNRLSFLTKTLIAGTALALTVGCQVPGLFGTTDAQAVEAMPAVTDSPDFLCNPTGLTREAYPGKLIRVKQSLLKIVGDEGTPFIISDTQLVPKQSGWTYDKDGNLIADGKNFEKVPANLANDMDVKNHVVTNHGNDTIHISSCFTKWGEENFARAYLTRVQQNYRLARNRAVKGK